MKKSLFILCVLFVLSLVLSEHSRDVFTGSIGWYHYEVTHTWKTPQILTGYWGQYYETIEGYIPVKTLAFAGWDEEDQKSNAYYVVNPSSADGTIKWVPFLQKNHPWASRKDGKDFTTAGKMLTSLYEQTNFDSDDLTGIYSKNILTLGPLSTYADQLQNNQFIERDDGYDEWTFVKVFKYKAETQMTEVWKTKSNENEWHIYNPEEFRENNQGYRSYRLNSIDTLTYPNEGYSFKSYFASIGQYDVIQNREIKLIKSPKFLDAFAGILEDENTMTKILFFSFIFCLIGYITALKRTKIDPDLIVIKGGWDYFWLALPYVIFITGLLFGFEVEGFLILLFITSIGLLVKSIMHNKGAENIFLSFISKIFVVIILVLIVFIMFGGTKKDGRFKDGSKGNQATKNKVMAGGIAYGLILSLIHGSSAWKNEFKGKLKE